MVGLLHVPHQRGRLYPGTDVRHERPRPEQRVVPVRECRERPAGAALSELFAAELLFLN